MNTLRKRTLRLLEKKVAHKVTTAGVVGPNGDPYDGHRVQMLARNAIGSGHGYPRNMLRAMVIELSLDD